MKTVIVYYSMNGNTAWAAGRIARSLDADLLELKPRRAYPDRGARKFLWGGKSALMGEKPALEPFEFSACAYDCVVLATPLWAGRIAPPLHTFLAGHGGALADKRWAAVICCAGGRDEKALAQMRGLIGAAPAAALRLVDPKDRPDPENDARLAEFCRALAAEHQP